MGEDILYAVGNSVEDGNNIVPYAVKQHDDDVIFSKESLEEFIRLIQRQGINNLTVYSVSDLLAGSPAKYKSITARFPPPNFDEAPQEFELDELKDRKGYFVFVRYSFCWEGDENGGVGPVGKKGYLNGRTFTPNNNGEYHSLNEINGRHIFVKTINDIIIYKQSQAKTVISDQLGITENTLVNGITSEDYKNGTFIITVDNIQYVVKIKGFNDDGDYIGTVKDSTTTNSARRFLRGDGTWTNELQGPLWVNATRDANFGAATAAFVIGPNDGTTATMYIDNNELLIQAIGATTANPTLHIQNGAGYTCFGNTIYPHENYSYNLGTSNYHWKNIYGQNLYLSTAADSTSYPGAIYVNGTALNMTNMINVLNSGGDNSDTAHFWRGDSTWANTLTGTLSLTSAVSGKKHTDNTIPTSSNALFYANGNGYFAGNLSANKVFKAVFNDYAEYRPTINLEPGRVVIDNDDGTLSCADKRLMPGAQVISDTFGDAMGYTEQNQTPLAVAGRVLVYTYQPREKYHAGMAVCAAPGGTVDIMTREEIKEYPDCIIGIVSEIPQYERWGTDQVEVKGRIWIKIK